MTKEPLILAIEDEQPIRSLLKTSLLAHGYAWEEASTAETGLSLGLSLKPDLVLLDLGLPDRDGLRLIEPLRVQSPIIVLSARGSEDDKVQALERGADDYLTKPFGEQELLARVRAVLRRGTPTESLLTFGPLHWDRTARRLFLEGEEVHLSPVEYRLFSAMALRPGRILTHSWLLQEVWGRRSDEMVHYVRIGVSGLRKKLERTGTQFLHTEVGSGYRFFGSYSSERPPSSTT